MRRGAGGDRGVLPRADRVLQDGWDARKDAENPEKHGVPFAIAQFAFGDPNRAIAEDHSHGSNELRHYRSGLSRVGFSLFGLPGATMLFAYAEPVTGEKERKSMSAKIK